jgi:peptide-methionine (S)-S-oxide reductase
MEGPFEEIDGVQSVSSGYTGGHTKNPTYKEVCTGTTGHAESIQIVYDPSKVDYETLLHTYWRNIDPTTPDRQFCDVGSQYRPEIFYHDEEQLHAAEKSKKEIEESGVVDEVAVRISPASDFYLAEDYHQNFYVTNPEHYMRYRMGCGRDRRLADIWGESDH